MNSLGQSMDAAGQVLGHGTTLHRLHTHSLQGLGKPKKKKKTQDMFKKKKEFRVFMIQWVYDYKKLQVLDEVRVAIKFAAVLQAFGPGEDAGDGVGAGGPPLEVKVRMRSQCWHVITIETNHTPFSVLEEFVSTCYSPFSPQDGSRISQTALFPRVPVLFFFFFPNIWYEQM